MKIFVYGTLKKGHCRSNVLDGQTFLGEALTSNIYRLFNCGSYPGFVKCEAGISIEGELWEVNEDCLAKLDRIEGIPFLYKRDKVLLVSHPEEEVETYFFQQDTSNLKDCGSSWEWE